MLQADGEGDVADARRGDGGHGQEGELQALGAAAAPQEGLVAHLLGPNFAHGSDSIPALAAEFRIGTPKGGGGPRGLCPKPDFRRGEDDKKLPVIGCGYLGAVHALAMAELGRSTVPVGTSTRLARVIEASGSGASLAWNPEFLREGLAVKDTISPDRLVYGVRAGDEASVAALDEVYAAALANDTPRVVTDFATA